MRHLGIALLAAVVGMTIGIGANAQNMPAKKMNGMLTTPAGMTLYMFDKDTAGSGKSACNGPCAANWPPLAASGDAKASGDWSVITRDDGSKQWAYNGKPLYQWSKDQKAGDMTGDGFNSVWHVAKY